ncbi:MAG TPA: hypothetical protein VNO21_23575, partial [Polyangiaceae bacterium]|nr:hypothetical protein [Polyangiaceae bacterium]
MSHPRPAAAVSNAQRIDDIDVVRGMALCGVLVSNLVEMFRVPWGRTYQVPGTGRIDDYVDALMGTAFQGNVIHLTFSLIFGLGMAISSERVLATGASAHRLLVRKQLILLVIGLIHATLIWNGDVLVSYALVGLAILPFLRSRTRTLLLGALVMAIIFCLPIYPVRPSPESVENTQRVARALEAYQNGTWWDVQAQGMSDLRYMWRYAVARHLFAEGMAFCLGFAVWRGGLLTAPEQHRRAMQWTLMGGAVSLIVVVLRYAGFLPSVSSSSFGSFGPAARFLWQFAYLVTNT